MLRGRDERAVDPHLKVLVAPAGATWRVTWCQVLRFITVLRSTWFQPPLPFKPPSLIPRAATNEIRGGSDQPLIACPSQYDHGATGPSPNVPGIKPPEASTLAREDAGVGLRW